MTTILFAFLIWAGATSVGSAIVYEDYTTRRVSMFTYAISAVTVLCLILATIHLWSAFNLLDGI